MSRQMSRKLLSPSLTAQLQPEAAAADTASTEVKEPEAAETQTPAASQMLSLIWKM